MIVIPPVTINDAILTDTNVAETDYAAWNSVTTYALAARSIVVAADVHQVYESLVAGNLNHDPQLDDQDDPQYWLLIGPTNRWKMFDLLRNTQTEVATPLEVELTPGQRVNSLALLGLDAEQVQVVVVSGVETVYDNTIDLGGRETLGWYDYLYGAFAYPETVLLTDLPPVSNAVITVTITRAAGTVKCGGLVIGNREYMGEAQHGAESDALNFSVVERDEFGNSVLVPRRSIPTNNLILMADKARVNRLRALRSELNAVPAVWSALDDSTTDGYFDMFLILGVYQRFTINATYPGQAVVNLELEEI